MRVYVENYGCWLNKALSEYVKQVVSRCAEIVEDAELADAVIINTCAVRGDTERKILRRLRELASTSKRIAVTGCLVNVRPYSILEVAPKASLVEPSYLSELPRFVQGEELWLVREYRRAIFAGEYTGGVRYVIPIEVGCTGACGFCVEPLVRREVTSLDPELVLRLVADAVRRGAKEVYLTGQDVAAYGLDLGLRLTDLIRRILSEVDGDYRIRIGMMEPWMAKSIADELSELIRDERVYKYVHLPLQSGDDAVLRLMRRRYTVEEYRNLIQLFRRRVGELSVATDIIVGYPGEDWEAFLRSVKVVQELKFDKVHVARYTFRPFTPAYTARDTVAEPEKKRRSRILTEVALRVAASINSTYLGKELEALVCESGKKEGTVIARTGTYKPVILPDTVKVGERVRVRIKGYTPLHLVGEVID